MTELKPIFLLADSQLLFWKEKDTFFLSRLLAYIDINKKIEKIKAAYIGASNGDDPVYFDIFKAAMEQIGIINCRMIPSKPDIADMDFLNLSDLILLAGGELKKGWEVFIQNNFDKTILDKYHNGVIIIGLSAGAVQLGLNGWVGESNKPLDLFYTFKIIPYIIDVHHEHMDWKQLQVAVERGHELCKGYGINKGGGLIFYPDWSIEAVRYSLTEFVKENEVVKQSLITPPIYSSIDDNNS